VITQEKRPTLKRMNQSTLVNKMDAKEAAEKGMIMQIVRRKCGHLQAIWVSKFILEADMIEIEGNARLTVCSNCKAKEHHSKGDES